MTGSGANLTTLATESDVRAWAWRWAATKVLPVPVLARMKTKLTTARAKSGARSTTSRSFTSG